MPITARRHPARQAPPGLARYARRRINSRNCAFHSYKPKFRLGLRPISFKKFPLPNGNRITENAAPVATYDTQDRLLTWKGNTYTYNPAGDLAGKTNTATNKTTSYTYDAQGNLRKVVLPNQTITYAIDPAGRRTGKSIDGALQWQLVWMSSLRPLARLKADNTLDQTYYYGDKPNVPEAMSAADGKTYRIVSDQNGSVRLVIDASTGEVAQQIEYDTWGQVTSDTNPGFQPFGFAGGLYDPDTGLTRFGARDYDAETGRWTAKDPILFGGGDSNLYGYVAGDPVNWIDPQGLNPAVGVLGSGLGSGAAGAGAAGAGAAAMGAAAVVGSGYLGWQAGSWIYPRIEPYLSPAIDLVFNHQKNPPDIGPPGGWIEGPRRGRKYCPDGTPEYDIDKPHQGNNEPHVHEWPNGIREEPGRPVSPLPRPETNN